MSDRNANEKEHEMENANMSIRVNNHRAKVDSLNNSLDNSTRETILTISLGQLTRKEFKIKCVKSETDNIQSNFVRKF